MYRNYIDNKIKEAFAIYNSGDFQIQSFAFANIISKMLPKNQYCIDKYPFAGGEFGIFIKSYRSRGLRVALIKFLELIRAIHLRYLTRFIYVDYWNGLFLHFL